MEKPTGMNYFFVIHGSERVYPDETVSLDNLYLKRRYILLGYRMTAKFLKYLSNWGNKSYSDHHKLCALLLRAE